jgi:hypothetical protein
MASYSSAEAKKEFFLTADDLRDLPAESLSFGFGTGRPMKLYSEEDLEAAAVAKHGREGLAKKGGMRKKRESNKRKRKEEATAIVDPEEATEKQRVTERNLKIVGRKWDLVITSPERLGQRRSLFSGAFLPQGGQVSKSFLFADDVRIALD